MTTSLYSAFKADLDRTVEAGLATSDRIDAWDAVNTVWAVFDAHGGYGAWKDAASEASIALYRHATSIDAA